MVAHRRLFLFFCTSVLIALCAGCGSSNSNQLAGTPQGTFSNANLSGSYVFAVSGQNTGGFFAIAGSFQANGSGTITSGIEDINSPGTSAPLLNLSITGTYSVGADGRSTMTLTSSNGSVDVRFVLLSGQHGLVVRYDTNATASGTIDSQDSSAFSLSALAGNFAFGLSGIDAGGHPDANAGVVAITSAGSITSGIEDDNDNGLVTQSIPVSSGTATNPANGRGSLSISSTAGTFNYVYYVINASHVVLVETDTSPVLSGVAFRQTSTAISGSYVFTNAGTGASGPFASAGLLVTDGAGNVQSSSVEDVNNAGVLSQNVAIAGTYAVAGSGRGTLTLNGNLGTSNFAIYPSTGGILAVETDSTLVTIGLGISQSAGSFTNASFTGPYAFNLSGVTVNGELDSIAQFTANGTGSLTGALDVNNVGTLTTNLALSGTYAVGANGRGVATLNTSNGAVNIAFYIANNSSIPFVELDASEVATGTIGQQ